MKKGLPLISFFISTPTMIFLNILLSLIWMMNLTVNSRASEDLRWPLNNDFNLKMASDQSVLRLHFSGQQVRSAPPITHAIIYIHGMGEFIEMADNIAEHFKDKPVHFLRYDAKGHGKNESFYNYAGKRVCHVKSFSEHTNHLKELVGKLKQQGYKKIDVLTHSTGGLIVLKYLIENEGDHGVRNVGFSSPFLGFHGPNGKYLIPLLSPILGRLPWVNQHCIEDNKKVQFSESVLTHERSFFEAFRNHPLKCADPTFSWIFAAHRAHNFVMANASKIKDVNFYVALSGQERIVDNIKSKAFFKKLKAAQGDTARGEIEEFPDHKHVHFHETGREKVFKKVDHLFGL